MAAMFTIAIATSLVAVSGLIGSEHAITAKNELNIVLLHRYLWPKPSLSLPKHKIQMLTKHKC